MTLLDTGPLVALIDDRDGQHHAAARAMGAVPGKASTTWAVVGEALHLLGVATVGRRKRLWPDSCAPLALKWPI